MTAIIIGIALVSATILIGFAIHREQQGEKPAAKEEEKSKNVEKGRKKSAWMIYVGIALIVGAIAFAIWGDKVKGWFSSGSSQVTQAIPNCSEAKAITVGFKPEQVDLQMTCWSVSLDLPAGNVPFKMTTTGEFHGIKFWDGKVLGREEVLAYLKDHDGWMAGVSSSKFRLRGTGKVTIWIEKKEKEIKKKH